MSNPYLTMYGDTLSHAWENKAKEKAYNHQYYMRNRERLLAQRKALSPVRNIAPRGVASGESIGRMMAATSARGNIEAQKLNEKAANASRMIGERDSSQMDQVNALRRARQNYQNRADFARNKASVVNQYVSNAIREANDQREARRRRALAGAQQAYDTEQANIRKNALNRRASAGAQQARDAELARIRTGTRSKARAEAAEKIAANNTIGAKIQRGARAAAYKVAGTAERAARRATRAIKNSAVGKKAAEIADRAKKAFEQAKLKFRAAKGAGGDLSGKARAAYDRAKELYQKAKDKVNSIRSKFAGK